MKPFRWDSLSELLRRLEAVASIYVGAPVRVWLMDRKLPALGMADWHDGGYRIGLRGDLAAKPEELTRTFWHEVAHIALGHVPTREPLSPAAGDVRAGVAAVLSAPVGVRGALADQEAEVEAWIREHCPYR